MPYSESIGKVVGKDGKTYKPAIEKKEGTSNTIRFTFSEEEGPVEPVEIKLPVISGRVDKDSNQYIFEYVQEDINQDGVILQSINLKDLEGKMGPAGKVEVGTVNINKDDILKTNDVLFTTNGDFKTSGKFFNDDNEYKKLYIITSDDIEELRRDTYIAEYDDTSKTTQWTRINDAINISEYVTLEEYRAFKEEIDTKMTCIASQQKAIKDILRNGIDVEIEETSTDIFEIAPLHLNSLKVTWSDGEVKEGPITAYEFIQNIINGIDNAEQ